MRANICFHVHIKTYTCLPDCVLLGFDLRRVGIRVWIHIGTSMSLCLSFASILSLSLPERIRACACARTFALYAHLTCLHHIHTYTHSLHHIHIPSKEPYNTEPYNPSIGPTMESGKDWRGNGECACMCAHVSTCMRASKVSGLTCATF